MTFSHVPTGGVQAILDAHPNETVIIDGTGYRPAIPNPGSGSCARPPAQSATFDPAQLSDAELASYGLPPHPTGPGATPAHLAAWAAAVRSSKHRVCTGRPLFDALTGGAIEATSNYSKYQAGNIDNGTTFSWVSADWTIPSVAHSNCNVKSLVWTGIGDDTSNVIQGGTGQDVGVIPFCITDYYLWYDDWPNDPNLIREYSANSGDSVFGETYTPNCEYVVDSTTNNYFQLCKGPNVTNTDADFIVERPSGFNGTYWGLSNFGSVLIYNTNTSNGNPDTSTHYWLMMTTDGTSGGSRCAHDGAWVGEQFYVYWDRSCN